MCLAFAVRTRRACPRMSDCPPLRASTLFPGYQGAAYLGAAYNPFDVDTESKYLHYSYNVTGRDGRSVWRVFRSIEATRAGDRRSLLQGLDHLERKIDQRGVMDTVDRHQQDALSMVLGGKARHAFNLDLEDPRLSAKYGNNPWGRYTLMARRLVESGVTFVTVDMPHWDDHSNIKVGHGGKLEAVDRAVGALMDDLIDRDLLDKTLVIVMGEFGRTPKINTGQPGIPIPGRDHLGRRDLGDDGRRGTARRHGRRPDQRPRRIPDRTPADAARPDGDDLRSHGDRHQPLIPRPLRPPNPDPHGRNADS